MKLFRPFLFQIYLLQLENYHLGRYFKLAGIKAAFDPLGRSQRQKIVWTLKAKIIFALGLLIAIFPAQALAQYFNSYPLQVILTIALTIFFANTLATGFVSLAVLVFWPVDFIVKKTIIARAKRKLAKHANLKVIGITGSYGKTTMKECLAPILSEKYNVLKTPENINTPVGVARLILEKLNEQTEILILEMGAYQKGDIQELCEIASPDIAILTGINEAHLEQFGSIENTIETKFEVVKFAKKNATVVLNEENALVKGNFNKYVGSRKVLWYNTPPGAVTDSRVSLLGSYVPAVLSACSLVAKELGLADGEINSGLGKIQPIPHRLQKIENTNGVTVIDDSYNGNPAGVAEAIKVLAKFIGRRKIYITPGLVEMGAQTENVHRSIGHQLALVADTVILIRNSVTGFIADGLKENGFNDSNIIWFNSATEAHAALSSILKSGDVILFQNDWPDNYS